MIRGHGWLGDSNFREFDRTKFVGDAFDFSGRGGWIWRAYFNADPFDFRFAIGEGENGFLNALWWQQSSSGEFSSSKVEFDDGRHGRQKGWRQLKT